MKPRSIAIVLVAGLALVLWIAWLFGHSTESGPGNPAAATPAETPAGSMTAAATPAAVNYPAVAASVTPAPAMGVAAAAGLAVPASGTAPATNARNAANGAPRQIDRAAAMLELQKVRTMIASYHTLMGQNPVGTNAEIMKALMGGNPRQATLGPPPGQTLNAKGELLDPWGTPYFFHQLSGDDMEIHSAGPDRIMWTKDDLVIH